MQSSIIFAAAFPTLKNTNFSNNYAGKTLIDINK